MDLGHKIASGKTTGKEVSEERLRENREREKTASRNRQMSQ